MKDAAGSDYESHDYDRNAYAEAAEAAFDKEQEAIHRQLGRSLVIALAGSLNAGKSTAINALTGVDYADVSPLPGKTKDVAEYPLGGAIIADTPGLYDPDQEVSARTEAYLKDKADIIVFFVNALVGVTQHDKQMFDKVKAKNPDVLLVLSRIDGLDSQKDIDLVVGHAKKTLGVTPIPFSSKTGHGVQDLARSMTVLLRKKGKDLIFAKLLKDKQAQVDVIVHSATGAAFAVGALPLPGSDLVGLSAIQVGMALKIAYIYDHEVSKSDILTLISQTVLGGFGRKLYQAAVAIGKGAGWFTGGLLNAAIAGIGGAVAAALTYAFGRACDAYYKSGMNLDMSEFKGIFETVAKEYKKKHPAKKPVIS